MALPRSVKFLALGSDLLMMTQKAQELLAAVKPDESGKDVARY